MYPVYEIKEGENGVNIFCPICKRYLGEHDLFKPFQCDCGVWRRINEGKRKELKGIIGSSGGKNLYAFYYEFEYEIISAEDSQKILGRDRDEIVFRKFLHDTKSKQFPNSDTRIAETYKDGRVSLTKIDDWSNLLEMIELYAKPPIIKTPDEMKEKVKKMGEEITRLNKKLDENGITK